MICYRRISSDDFDIVKRVWNFRHLYQDKYLMGIPFTLTIENICNNSLGILAYDNDTHEYVALCCYEYKKKLKEFRIEHLIINPLYSRKGIGTELLKQVLIFYKEINNKASVLLDIPITVTCVKGAENNKFYEKFSYSSPQVIEKKVVTLYKYILDRRLIEER